MFAESVDVAEHSSTLECAMDAQLIPPQTGKETVSHWRADLVAKQAAEHRRERRPGGAPVAVVRMRSAAADLH
jgi:hypothetical protein